MNILITLDRRYLDIARTMLYSLKRTQSEPICVYVLSTSLDDEDERRLESGLADKVMEFSAIRADKLAEKVKTTSRYPVEMYLRLFAKDFLPADADRVLYLDPDIIVRKNLEKLYHSPFRNASLYKATSHVKFLMRMLNSIRLLAFPRKVYPNTGVMMINLAELRKIGNEDERLMRIMRRRRNLFILPDQDVLYIAHGNRIELIEETRYNLSERIRVLRNADEKDAAIIHYAGRMKPWKTGYAGKLDAYWHETRAQMEKDGMA